MIRVKYWLKTVNNQCHVKYVKINWCRQLSLDGWGMWIIHQMLQVQVLRTTNCFPPFSFLSYDSYHVFWAKMTTWFWCFHSSHNPEIPRISKPLTGVPRFSFNKIKSQTCLIAFIKGTEYPVFDLLYCQIPRWPQSSLVCHFCNV